MKRSWKKFIAMMLVCLVFPIWGMVQMEESYGKLAFLIVAIAVTIYNINHFVPLSSEKLTKNESKEGNRDN